MTVEKGLTPKAERYNRSFLVKKNDKFKLVKNLDYIYNPMNITLGALDQNTLGYNVAVSGYYITMELNQDAGHDFFRVLLKKPQMINVYKRFATGSLIERQRVQFPTLQIIRVSVPKLSEQNSISKLFYYLDRTIALHQRKQLVQNADGKYQIESACVMIITRVIARFDGGRKINFYLKSA
ncbi:restriction endonuclease subunit S [Lacticaseibacillus sharpeae]|uniref:restriction endonuclease subunit S n=1 Tax=Lacticaseibacillus sharpeae TaxID=1626 RepID=UPI0012E8BA59|nr:restriction endonuclease subunit S [Lacticaseibacillus sharpeae]